jgi:hypothetical protein
LHAEVAHERNVAHDSRCRVPMALSVLLGALPRQIPCNHRELLMPI